MRFTFGAAVVIALLLGAFSLILGQWSGERLILLVFFLLLASIVPWLAVPIGAVAVLYMLITQGGIATWFQNFAGGTKKAT